AGAPQFDRQDSLGQTVDLHTCLGRDVRSFENRGGGLQGRDDDVRRRRLRADGDRIDGDSLPAQFGGFLDGRDGLVVLTVGGQEDGQRRGAVGGAGERALHRAAQIGDRAPI